MSKHLKDNLEFEQSFTPIEQLEHEMASDGVPAGVLDQLFGYADTAAEFGMEWQVEDMDKIRGGVPAHLAPFMPEDWQQKWSKGMDLDSIAEPKWMEPGNMGEAGPADDPEGMCAQTASVWAGLGGARRKTVSLFTPERRKVKAELRTMQAKGVSAEQFLKDSGYAAGELKQALRQLRKAEAASLLALMSMAGFVSAFNDGAELNENFRETAVKVSEQPVLEPADSINIEVPVTEPSAEIAVAEPPATTTTSAPQPAVPPEPAEQIATAVPPQPEAVKPKATGTTITGDKQAELVTIVANEPLSLEAKQLALRTADVDPNNRQQLYGYVDTLVAFNPNIDSPDVLPQGTPVSIWDCREPGARLVFSGPEELSALIDETGITMVQAKALEAGKCYVFNKN